MHNYHAKQLLKLAVKLYFTKDFDRWVGGTTDIPLLFKNWRILFFSGCESKITKPSTLLYYNIARIGYLSSAQVSILNSLSGIQVCCCDFMLSLVPVVTTK